MLFRGIVGRRKKPIVIESVEKATLRVSGMRYACEYEIVASGDETTVSLYRIVGNDRELEKSVCLPTSEVLDAMKNTGVGRWNGFFGPHPKNVSDGEMFDFEARVNGGEVVAADGSENFPKGYREFVGWLRKVLA